MSVPSVTLYTLRMTEVGQIRATLSAMKALLDNGTTRQNLINLHMLQPSLLELTYPTNLTGRIEALSEAIQALESTLSSIEDSIRGSLLYPVV